MNIEEIKNELAEKVGNTPFHELGKVIMEYIDRAYQAGQEDILTTMNRDHRQGYEAGVMHSLGYPTGYKAGLLRASEIVQEYIDLAEEFGKLAYADEGRSIKKWILDAIEKEAHEKD